MEVSHVIRGEEWLPSAPLHAVVSCIRLGRHTMPEFGPPGLLLKPEGNGKP